MYSRTDTGQKRSRHGSETSRTSGDDCESTRSKQARYGSATSESPSSTVPDSTPTPGTSDLDPMKEEGKEETPGPRVQPQDGQSFSGSAVHTDENEEIIITSIRATDIALGLRRLPAGFYVVVHHSDLEWRTEIKPSSTNHDIIEWSGPIPIPSSLSAIVRLEVYASFEYQPVLGAGEQLRGLTITAQQLLDHGASGVPFTLLEMDGDIVSPCSSISVTVKRRKCEKSDSLTSRVIEPCRSTTKSRGELEDATDQGHSALSRYRRYGEKQDLEHSIEQFEQALNICSLDHPCRAAALSNLAMAKFILRRVEDSDVSFPFSLYHNALALRLVGHLDRPSTLIQLAAMYFTLFEKGRNEAERSRSEELLHEAIELSSSDSYENQAATFMLQLHTGHRAGPVPRGGISSVEQESTSRSADEDIAASGTQLLDRFQRLGDLGDLEQVITISKELVNNTSFWDDGHRAGLRNLGVALLHRFKHVGELSDLEEAISMFTDAVDLTPNDHPDKPTHLNNLGNSFLTRFERFGDLSDLEDAISTLRDVVDIGSRSHPEMPACLSNLGDSLKTRFQHLGELGDLEDAGSMLRDAIDLTPDGHPEKPTRLNKLGKSIFTRFERLGESSDLEYAISMFRDAAELTPRSHSDKLGYLNNLGTAFQLRFEHLGELSDLEDAISTQRDAVELTPHGYPHRHICLNNLGNSFFLRFERLGKLSDLDEAISTLRDCVDLTPDGHPNKAAYIHNFGNSLFSRFERVGELSDLEDAISKQRHALDLTPDGHPSKPRRLNNLSKFSLARFNCLGVLSDLTDAISMFRDVVDLTPHGHPDKRTGLSNLGGTYLARYRRFGELSDLEDAISASKEAVDLTPHDHPDRPGYLTNLGNSLTARFERLGELIDLEDAISKHRDAVNLAPDDHPNKSTYLSNLGNALVTHFERLGEPRDLEDAISSFRGAVDLTPDGHPLKPTYLDGLGATFKARFDHLGKLSDLEAAITRQRNAVNVTPDGHPDKPARLNGLGNSFKTRFQHLGELSDLENAILTLTDAADLTPDDHIRKPTCLNNLSDSLFIRFEHVGELGDLEGAILRQRDAINITPDGHPLKPAYLNNLGNSFRTRFKRLGELSDLEDAISSQRDAIDLTPDSHPLKAGRLNSLGDSLRTRFEQLGELSDLADAILMLQSAVDLTPDGHPLKPGYLNNLGNSLRTRFERFRDLGDLDAAISRQMDAVNLTPNGHPDKLICLHNLGNSLLIRFQSLGELSDLENAIATLMDAAAIIPRGHFSKPACLNNLGNSLFTRFERLSELSDLEEAISRQKDAAGLTPEGHPLKPGYLSDLGNSFLVRFERIGELYDLMSAISLFSHAACAPFGPIAIRFHASQQWISSARRICHHSLLHAYSVAINLVPQLPWIGLTLRKRYIELAQGIDMAREAAAAALDSGLPETAVEWLEQGRSIVWGELLQLRSSHEELYSAHPDYAHRLRELSAALDYASATRERSLSTLSEEIQSAARKLDTTLEHASAIDENSLTAFFQQLQNAIKPSQEQAGGHRALAIKRDKLLQEIRRLPGFERFLLQKDFSQLLASAHAGPVVILNAAESRCDALIVVANVDRVIHVPLPNFTFKQSTNLQNTLKNFVRHARDGNTVTFGANWESFLAPLWKCVVKPVLDALAFSVEQTPDNLSRIFWCPTGPFMFLPIHAAGFYDTEHSQIGHKIFDFVVSSYIPSLAVLASSPNPVVISSNNPRLLLVPQPASDGLSRLRGVITELECIKAVVRNSPSAGTLLLESSIGTVEEVLSLMKEADWVHFACHGIQDGVDSGLCLADQCRLNVRDIISLSRPRGGLAFLSACQTAQGDERLSDEALHIAAGMLFAGYGGVVGTMWAISDSLAPVVAKDVYEYLFRNGTRPDYREAARALHEAIAYVRESDIASFDEWVPFIHVGL